MKSALLTALIFLPSIALADWSHRDNRDGRQHSNSGYHQGWHHKPYYHVPSLNNRPGRFDRGVDRGPPPLVERRGFNTISGPNEWRLREGYRDGLLSNREIADLRNQHRELAQRQAAFRRDGYLSDREREKLREEYREFQDNLSHELRDGERRF